MNNGNSGIAVYEEIGARLAAIKPEEFIASEYAPEEGDHFVTTATDGIKRLHTLRDLLVNEQNEIIDRLNEKIELGRQTLVVLLKKKPHKLTAEDWGRMPEEYIEEMRRMKADEELAAWRASIVNDMLTHEVRAQHRDLTNAPWVAICNDWSLRWSKEGPEEEVEEDIEFSFKLTTTRPAGKR